MKYASGVLTLLLMSGTTVLAFGGLANSQTKGELLSGVCFSDQRNSNERCACLDEAGVFYPERQYGTDNARLCANIDDDERARLTGPSSEITGSITPAPEVGSAPNASSPDGVTAPITGSITPAPEVGSAPNASSPDGVTAPITGSITPAPDVVTAPPSTTPDPETPVTSDTGSENNGLGNGVDSPPPGIGNAGNDATGTGADTAGSGPGGNATAPGGGDTGPTTNNANSGNNGSKS